MRKFITTLGFVSVMALAQPAAAEIERYTLDKPHTQILFFADHLGFSHSMGKFTDYNGGFTFNREDPAASSVEVTVPTASLEMNDEKWNEHMKSADFFNVEKFPAMTFKSTDIKVTGDNTADMTGELTLLGVTKPVTFQVKHNSSGKHAFSGKYISGFSATGTIKRSDFGMNYGLPMMGDDVEIRLEVEGVREEAEGEGAANK